MNTSYRWFAGTVACLYGMLGAGGSVAWAEVSPLRITTLYDAFGKTATMQKDWGFSAFVEYGGKRILFDTGGNGEIFANNVRAKGVDLTKLDFVVISHRHGDHTGGLSYLLKVNPKVKIYAPKDGLGGIFGSDIPSKFYRKDEALPAEMRYYGGTPPEIMKLGTVFPGANIQLIDKTTELVPGITLIALVSDAPGTKELKELSLAINTVDGIVLVVGCSHPGIEGIVAEAAKINPHKPIHLIFGGMHLLTATDEEITRVATVLHDTWKVEWIAPAHCTGEPAFAILQKSFGDRDVNAGLGSTLVVGPKVMAYDDSGAPVVARALNDEELRTYRALATGLDEEQPLLAAADPGTGF